MRLLYIISFFCYSLLVGATNPKNNLYITPEDFGCVSDKKEYAHNNSLGLQQAIEFAEKNGAKLISNASKLYFIKGSLVINSPIIIDFNLGTLVATDTVPMIIVDDGMGKRWSGKIAGIRLDLNKRSSNGILCANAVKLKITDCWIYNVPASASGLCVEKGYNVFVDNLHIEGGEYGATGIRIKTHDCHFSDCALINCHTAVDCGGSNFFERIHAWMGGKGKWLSGSIFFRVSNGGPLFLNQCFSDTYDIAFQIECKTKLFLVQHKNFHNIIMWDRDVSTIHPEFFHFVSGTVAKESYIVLNSSWIGGLAVDGKNRQTFSNISDNNVIVSNTIIVN